MSISIAAIVRVAIAIAVLLVILSYSGQLAVRAFDWHPERDIVQFFNLDRERNLPTTFQTLLFLGSSLSLAGIALMKRLAGDRWTLHWLALAGIFALLAWDEIAEIHERFIQPLRQAFDLRGIFFFGWIIPAGILVLILGAAYLRFMLALDPWVRNRFIAAAALFLGGALLLEGIGGWYYESIDQATDMTYVTLATVEETLEMAGLIVLFSTMLTYLGGLLPGNEIRISGTSESIEIAAGPDSGDSGL